ncbi:MAG: serine hydrolase, partial [Planctomycetota bacterium]
EVHDPRAAKLGGIAGHAGLFSTGADLARYARHLLSLAAAPPANSPPANSPPSRNDPLASTSLPRILSASTLAKMTQAYEVPRGIRGLGWDKQSPFSSNRAPGMSAAAYGHGGFTGTVLWIDPELDLFYVFLSNRVHPDGKGGVNPLAGQIGTIAVSAIQPRG